MYQSIRWLKKAITEADQPTITLMIGVPGSGKSTWTKANGAGLTIISSDDILEAWASESGVTYSDLWLTRFREAEKQMKQNLRDALARGDHILVDRTNMNKKVRRKILSQAPKNYLKFAALFLCDREEIERRLAQRAKLTGRWLGGEGNDQLVVVDRMLREYEPPTKDEFDEIFL